MKNESKEPDTTEKFIELMTQMLTEISGVQQGKLIKQKMQHKASRGYCLTKPPFGYRPTATTGLYEPNGSGIWLGTAMQALAEDKMQLHQAYALIKCLLTEPRKQQPTKQKVDRLLTNPYYAGFIVWRGKTYQGLHHALVTPAQHHIILDKIRAAGLPDKTRGQHVSETER